MTRSIACMHSASLWDVTVHLSFSINSLRFHNANFIFLNPFRVWLLLYLLYTALLNCSTGLLMQLLTEIVLAFESFRNKFLAFETDQCLSCLLPWLYKQSLRRRSFYNSKYFLCGRIRMIWTQLLFLLGKPCFRPKHSFFLINWWQWSTPMSKLGAFHSVCKSLKSLDASRLQTSCFLAVYISSM